MSPKEVIIEQVQVGLSLRVTAIDPATGTEVVFQAPASASKGQIQQLASNKLDYVLRKQQDG